MGAGAGHRRGPWWLSIASNPLEGAWGFKDNGCATWAGAGTESLKMPMGRGESAGRESGLSGPCWASIAIGVLVAIAIGILVAIAIGILVAIAIGVVASR